MKRYYTVKEASKLLGFSTNTIYSYLDSGKIKSRRIGKGRFKIPYDELAPYIQVTTKQPSNLYPSPDQATTGSSDIVVGEIGVNSGPGSRVKIYDFDIAQLFVAMTLFGLALITPLSGNFSKEELLSRFVALLTSSILILANSIFGDVEKKQTWISFNWFFVAIVTALCAYFDFVSQGGLMNGTFGFFLAITVLFTLCGIWGYSRSVEKISLTFQLLILGLISGGSYLLILLFLPQRLPNLLDSSEFISPLRMVISATVVLMMLGLAAFRGLPKYVKSVLFVALSVSFGLIALWLSYSSNWIGAFYCYASAAVSLFAAYWIYVASKVSKKVVYIFASAFMGVMFVVLVSILSLWWASNRFVDSTKEAFAADLSAHTWLLNRNFDRVRSSLASVETSSFLTNSNEGSPERDVNKLLRQVFDQTPYARAILFVGPDGKVRGAYPSSYTSIGSVSSAEWFDVVRRTLRPGVSNSIKFSEEYSVIYSSPLFENNNFSGLIAAVLDLDQVSSSVSIATDQESVAIDRNGIVVFDSNSKFEGRSADITKLKSDMNVYVEGTVITPGWNMALFAPLSSVKKTILPIYIIVSVLVAIFSAVILGASHVFAYKKSK